MNNELNYKHNKTQHKQGKKKKKTTFKSAIYFVIFISVVFLIFTNSSIATTTTKSDTESWLGKINFLQQKEHLISNDDREIVGKKRDRVNILLLGMGGKSHEGGYLTDTIMLASLEFSTKKVALISIPRDLSIPDGEGGLRKINNINAYAEAEQEGSGGIEASKEISKLLDMPIDYYARIDFSGFAKIIDDLGGVRVEVARTFDDYKYPVRGKEEAEVYEDRFEYLHFDKGWNQFDGSLALKYARSRHGTNGEASDFARARRQQQIIKAVKEKAMSSEMLKPSVITEVVRDLKDHVSTNIGAWEAARFISQFRDVKVDDLITEVLDNSTDGLLVDMIAESGAYILVPSTGNFSEIKYLVHNIFSNKIEEMKKAIARELPSIDVRNGTFKSGLAKRMADNLGQNGFRITYFGNASKRDFEKSIIYDLTYGEKVESLKALKQKVGGDVYLGLPDWLMSDLAKELKMSDEERKQPDFILILGNG